MNYGDRLIVDPLTGWQNTDWHSEPHLENIEL